MTFSNWSTGQPLSILKVLGSIYDYIKKQKENFYDILQHTKL